MVADGPTGREILLLSDIDDTVRLSSKVPTSVSSFQLRWGSSIIESWRGGGWGRGWRGWRLKCEDVDCICVSFQRSLPKQWWKYEKFKKTLIHREVRTVTSIFYVNGCAEISGNTVSIVCRYIFYCCVGISSHSSFFSLAFLRLKILAHKLLHGHACTCLFLCTCVFVRKTPHLLGDESLVLRTQTCYIFNTFQRDIPNVY